MILAGVTGQYGVDGLLLATCMAGVILILLGAANFGGVRVLNFQELSAALSACQPDPASAR